MAEWMQVVNLFFGQAFRYRVMATVSLDWERFRDRVLVFRSN
jgi:hypothetical protein